MSTFTLGLEFRVITPGCCGVPFGMHSEHYKRSYETREKQFFCPSCGSNRVWLDESESQKHYRLRIDAENQLAAERARHDQTRASKNAVERRLTATCGVVTRVKNRVSKGVCPCCNRYFANLHQHVASQHPDFVAEKLP